MPDALHLHAVPFATVVVHVPRDVPAVVPAQVRPGVGKGDAGQADPPKVVRPKANRVAVAQASGARARAGPEVPLRGPGPPSRVRRGRRVADQQRVVVQVAVSAAVAMAVSATPRADLVGRQGLARRRLRDPPVQALPVR